MSVKNESFADAAPLGADGQPVVEAAPSVAAAPGAVNEPQTEQQQPSTVDSFDSPDLTPEEQEVELAKLSEPDKGQVKKLDEEKVEDKPEDKKEEEPDKKKEDEEKDTKPEDSKEEVSEEKPKGKTIRMKDDEKSYDIPLEATIPVKVKGKKEFVSIQELRENFSGKQAWTEEISTAKSAQVKAEQMNEKTQAERQEITGHLTKIAGMLDKEDGNPMDALMYLVEMSGRNVLDYSKKVFSHMEESVHQLDEMDDVERKLYWREKEIDFIKNNQANQRQMTDQAKASTDRIEKVTQLRESQGVSEDQFVEAHNGLVKLGFNEDQITPEAVVNYSVMKPHYEKSEGLCDQFDADLTTDQMDALVETVARTSKSYPKLSDERLIQLSTEQLGWDFDTEADDIAELNSLAKDKPAPEPSEYKYKSSPEGQVESFDDFDEGTYGRNIGY